MFSVELALVVRTFSSYIVCESAFFGEMTTTWSRRATLLLPWEYHVHTSEPLAL